MYDIEFSNTSKEQLVKLKKNAPKLFKKAFGIFAEMYIDPRVGTGKSERLKGTGGVEMWSRRIDKSNRIVYSIENENVLVYVFSVIGHYGDK